MHHRMRLRGSDLHWRPHHLSRWYAHRITIWRVCANHLQPSTAVPDICEPSPTEPNTPSDSGDGANSSTERKSFSSLINYDPSSQTSQLVIKPTSRAEMLRLRLRVAMYKVKTGQTDVPFSRLRVEVDRKDRHDSRDSPNRATNEAVESAVAELRREAQKSLASFNNRPIPKLLPAPVLLPTAYSSRMIYEAGLPSSPPASLSPDKSRQSKRMATPHRMGRQPDSPPGSAERELTSSAVKGRVAEGLLGLRSAV